MGIKVWFIVRYPTFDELITCLNAKIRLQQLSLIKDVKDKYIINNRQFFVSTTDAIAHRLVIPNTITSNPNNLIHIFITKVLRNKAFN